MSLKRMYKTWRLKRKWKRKAKKRSTITLRVKSVEEFFSYLEEQNIEYCSLRWPDEVPFGVDLSKMSNDEVDKLYGDIDLLVGLDNFEKLFGIYSLNGKGMKVDVYSATGAKGMNLKGVPYYPPNKARDILDNTVLYKGFKALQGIKYIQSLVYHLIYHKALTSGIPTGVDGLESAKNPKKNYLNLLLCEAQTNQVHLPSEVTLLSLHEWLVENKWAVPYDLLPRWPIKCKFIEYLRERAFAEYKTMAQKYPGFIVFVLRGNLHKFPIAKELEKTLAKKFNLAESASLDKVQKKEAIANLRGGNWLALKGGELVEPYHYLAYYDCNPEPVICDSTKEKFPEIDNNNLLIKHEIRKKIDTEIGIKNAIHSSDNALEAFYMYRYLTGDKVMDKISITLEALIKK